MALATSQKMFAETFITPQTNLPEYSIKIGRIHKRTTAGRTYYAASVLGDNNAHIILQTGIFMSSGTYHSNGGELIIRIVDEDCPMLRQTVKAMYEKVLPQVYEQTRNLTFPEGYDYLKTSTLEDMPKYCKPFMEKEDGVCFLTINPQALVIDMDSGLTSTMADLDKANLRPGRGIYKIRINPRFLYIGDTNYKFSFSFRVDQIAFKSTLFASAPVAVAMDLSEFAAINGASTTPTLPDPPVLSSIELPVRQPSLSETPTFEQPTQMDVEVRPSSTETVAAPKHVQSSSSGSDKKKKGETQRSTKKRHSNDAQTSSLLHKKRNDGIDAKKKKKEKRN